MQEWVLRLAWPTLLAHVFSTVFLSAVFGILVAPRMLASYLYKHGQYPIWQQTCLDHDHHPIVATVRPAALHPPRSVLPAHDVGSSFDETTVMIACGSVHDPKRLAIDSHGVASQ